VRVSRMTIKTVINQLRVEKSAYEDQTEENSV